MSENKIDIVAMVFDVSQWPTIEKIRKERTILAEYINLSPYQKEPPKIQGFNVKPEFGIMVTAVFECVPTAIPAPTNIS